MDDVPESVRQLRDALIREQHECAICTERIRRVQPTWSCGACYSVFHLACMAYWATAEHTAREAQLRRVGAHGVAAAAAAAARASNSSNGSSSNGSSSGSGDDATFRCPMCQAVAPVRSTRVYVCFCGKVVNPPVDVALVPGSCGQPCGRRRADVQCPHRCVLICHPGKCPPCPLTREQACYCGKQHTTVGCSSEVDGFVCGDVCGRVRNCGRHVCTSVCHAGPCAPCEVLEEVTCYCGAATRTRRCGAVDDKADASMCGSNNNEDGAAPSFRCGGRCGKMRDCGRHVCGLLCHPGACELCYRTPARQRYCPCGKTPVHAQRTACTDAVPSCGQTCELPLPCGHLCWYTCHDATPCAPCKQTLTLPCRCGAQTAMRVPCFCQYLPQEAWQAAANAMQQHHDDEAQRGAHAQGGNSNKSSSSSGGGAAAAVHLPTCFPPRCTRVCRKWLSCHKHKCTHVCCVDDDHTCMQVCNKKLGCGRHRCGQLCHAGPCPPCNEVSHERLYCRCRRTWVEPPVPCGTPVPTCTYPCIVPRPCGHAANHPCHTADVPCTECVVLVPKLCASHKLPMPYHMPCHLSEVSCGKRCKKPLACCGGVCERVCHGGACVHKCSNRFPSFAEVVKK